MPQGEEGKVVRFGSFEVDIGEGKLTKSGIRIRLQDQPFRILALLLENAGQVVTRDAIRQELWAQDTFVEFDKALNTAVGKLRSALSDTADNPRFLETVPRRGYRFIAPVTHLPQRQAVPTQLPAENPAVSLPVGSDVVLAESRPVPAVSYRSHWRQIGIIALALLAAAGLAIYWRQRTTRFQITPKDTIVLADFVNTTGEVVFDDSLRQGLEVGFEQSPFVKVLSDRRVGRILKQMGRSSDERLTGKTAVEVCQRANSKVAVQGSIASLGTTYLIGLAAMRCDTGELLENEQLQARRKEDVVDVLGQAASHLRGRLGESLPSIQKFNAPLEQATTPSLDALRAYGLALSTWDKKGDRESLPFFQKAVDLDPNFALAYGALATIYHNLGQSELARQNASKAYELRARVTESEKATIEARYYAYVTGELEKAAQVHTLEVQNYPDSAGAHNHIAVDEAELGLYEISAEGFRKALTLDPTRATTYANLATDLLALNRLDEATAVIADSKQRKLETQALLQVEYWIAFVRGDSGEMERLIQRSKEIPGTESLFLAEQSNTEAYHGHFGKARELSLAAATLMEKEGDNASAANCLAQAALSEAEVGNYARARAFTSQAEKLSSQQNVVVLTAVSMARIGDSNGAEERRQSLNNEWPSGTYVQKYWLPLIQAETHLRKRLWSNAIDDLTVTTPPIEFASPPALPVATLYPTFVRGQAYLVAGDGSKALIEFQKLADHRSFMVNSLLWPLSRLELARAYTAIGDSGKARQSCQEFLQLWNDADSDLPYLKDAESLCRKTR